MKFWNSISTCITLNVLKQLIDQERVCNFVSWLSRNIFVVHTLNLSTHAAIRDNDVTDKRFSTTSTLTTTWKRQQFNTGTDLTSSLIWDITALHKIKLRSYADTHPTKHSTGTLVCLHIDWSVSYMDTLSHTDTVQRDVPCVTSFTVFLSLDFAISCN